MCVCQPDTATEAGVESHPEAGRRHRVLNGIRKERRQDVAAGAAAAETLFIDLYSCTVYNVDFYIAKKLHMSVVV